MKVVIVYPDYAPAIGWNWQGYFHHGIASVSASLKQAGHQTALIHVTRPMSAEEFVERVRQESPDLVGFSSTTNLFQSALELLSWLRDAYINVPVIFGGVHATLASNDLIERDGIDYVCVGEGERPFVELCDRLVAGKSTHDILNIWAKINGEIYRNQCRPLLQNLDELPFADRALFNYGALHNESQGVATIMASRGCPFSCNYCCNHALRANSPHQKYVRFRSVDHVLAEISEIKLNYPYVKAINFDDDILFLHKDWFAEFTEKYKKQIGLPFHCNYRPGLRDETAIGALAEAGCKHVQIGLESGNDKIRNLVLGRHMRSESIAKTIRVAHEHGIRVETNSMVGIPGETPQTILDTIKLNARTAPDRTFVSIFYPFPGTNLYDHCVQNGFITDRQTTSFFFDSILQLDTVSREQILMFKRYFSIILASYKMALSIKPTFLFRIIERILDLIFSSRPIAKLAVRLYNPLLRLRRRFLPKQKNLLFDTTSQSGRVMRAREATNV